MLYIGTVYTKLYIEHNSRRAFARAAYTQSVHYLFL